jgi:very-short-patch-repair endonuclease
VEVPTVLASCGRVSQGLVTFRQLRAAGLARSSIAAAVADGSIVRVHRRVYSAVPLPTWTQFVVTDAGPAPAYVAHVRAALLSLGPGAAACGRTAAALRGRGLLIEPSRTVEVAVPHGSRRAHVPHVRVFERRGITCEPVFALPECEPIPATSAVQTVLDCSRTLPLLEAVVAADSALRARDVTLEELQCAARALPGVRDAARARKVLSLYDPECGSVLESVLRVRMLLDGMAGFATQVVLRDASGSVRVDFAFAAARVVIEVDGTKWHQDVDRDRTRDNRLAAMGWRVLRYRWAEVVHDGRRVLAEIRETVGLETSDCQSAVPGARRAA